MKNEIIQSKPSIAMHKKNSKEKEPSKKVFVWRGIDKKTYNYMLTNRYYDATILTRNNLQLIVDLKNTK